MRWPLVSRRKYRRECERVGQLIAEKVDLQVRHERVLEAVAERLKEFVETPRLMKKHKLGNVSATIGFSPLAYGLMSKEGLAEALTRAVLGKVQEVGPPEVLEKERK